MDTRVDRWRRLAEGCELLTPARRGPFPLVILIPGALGPDAATDAWARAAVRAGWAALVVDSFGPRHWGPRLRRLVIEPGLMFRGRRRAGDVLAAIEAARRMPVIDPDRMALAGTGHGGWAVLELLAQPLIHRGEVRIADASQARLHGVIGALVAAPRLSWRTALHPWPRTPRLACVLPQGSDARPAMRALAPAIAAGCHATFGAGPSGPHPGEDRPTFETRLALAATPELAAFLAGLQPSTTTSPLRELAT